MTHPLHNPARGADESQAEYRARRRQSQAVIAGNRRGTMAHVSTEPAILPLVGVDSRVDKAVLRDEFRDLQRVLMPPPRLPWPHGPRVAKDAKAPEQIRIGRTKGDTFRKAAA